MGGRSQVLVSSSFSVYLGGVGVFVVVCSVTESPGRVAVWAVVVAAGGYAFISRCREQSRASHSIILG